MSLYVTPEHLRLAERLVAKARANGGLAPLDLDRFWVDQEVARRDPWSPACPQVPLGIMMSSECLFAELGLPEDWHRLTHDAAWRTDQNRRYNDIAQRVVGRRLLPETAPDATAPAFPGTRALHDIFEARNVWHNDSYWLMPAAANVDELRGLLDRVEARLADLRAFVLPPGWDERKAGLLARGLKPGMYRGQRGPITFAMSVYGVENLIYLILDQPDLAARYRDLILRSMLELARVLEVEAGHTPETAPHGFYFCDDNCALLNAEMYEFFGYPILAAVFGRFSPAPQDLRGQHSDSDMAHLLPILGRLGLNSVNFGPTVRVSEIREHLPRAAIHGQLAPFTFSRNEEVSMVAEFCRDVEMAREKRGLVFATAGSINNGSRLTGMRLLMAAIQEYGRYDR